MARYSDNREQNREVKHLVKVWSKVDRQIEMPETLSGDALLPLLDKVPTHRPVSRKIRFSPRFTWKSGVTYAAAFILVVALSAMLGRRRPETDLTQGPIMPDPPIGEHTPYTPPSDAPDDAPLPEDPGDPDTPQAGTDAPATPRRPDGDGEKTTADPDAPPAEDDGDGGVGGQSKSIPLGKEGPYTYTYRVNDETDPDKAGLPVTVNILHTDTGVLAFQMDLSDLVRIDRYFVHENIAAFLGPAPDGETALCVYDISRLRDPREVKVLRQPGELVDARLYKSVVSVATFAPAGTHPDGDVISLPGGTGEDLCILSTLDLESMETQRTAFSGAGRDVQLYNLSAYLQYTGEETEENKRGQYIAHVRIDGTEISLRSEPDDDAKED